MHFEEKLGKNSCRLITNIKRECFFTERSCYSMQFRNVSVTTGALLYLFVKVAGGVLNFLQFCKYFIYFAVQNYFSPVFCWQDVIFHWINPLIKTDCILYNWFTEYNFEFKLQRHVNGYSFLSKLKRRDCSVTATSQFYSCVIHSNLTSRRKFKWKHDNKYAGLFKSFYVHVRCGHLCRGMSSLCSFLQCVI